MWSAPDTGDGAGWKAFLRSLAVQGLAGGKMVIADDLRSLKSDLVFELPVATGRDAALISCATC